MTSLYPRGGKRLFDVVLSGVCLVVLSPLLILVSVLVFLRLGSPVLFRQERPGLGSNVFYLYKFRTMTMAVDKSGALLPDAERLDAFGRWLRTTSLDELPELWNVLRGEMSMVGPRPLLTAYLPLYSKRQARRHDVRPGLTGWAQVNGRNTISWAERFELDLWYLENVSFVLDLKILWKTLKAVVRRSGISARGEATVRPFDGTQ